MPKDRDEKSGKYTETYPPEDFIEAIKSLSGSASTKEVAEEVGCAYRTAHAKLTTLEEQGKISSRSVGNARLWKIAEGE